MMEAEVGDAWSQAEECGWPLETRKGKEIDFPLESPEGRQCAVPF